MKRFTSFVLGAASVATAIVLFAACAADPAPSNPLKVNEDTDSGRRRDGGGDPNIDLPDGADPFLDDGGKPPGRIYANTYSTLYRFDPLSGTLTEVGAFDCVPRNGPADEVGSTRDNDAVLDIALDRSGQMYGTTYWRFIKISAADATCQVVKLEPTNNLYPNSLSFVPLGPVDQTNEALIGYGYEGLGPTTVYTRIDLATGARTVIGSLNPTPLFNGQKYGLSGDVISLVRDQGKTFGAIKQLTGDAGAGTDLLAQLDPATGKITKIVGNIGQTGLYGMGFWAGKAYGFGNAGGIYEIDPVTAKSKLVLQAQGDGGAPLVWYGAGVTTDSPTAP